MTRLLSTLRGWQSGLVVLLLAILLHPEQVSAQERDGPASCPPDTAILPCRCRLRDSNEVQIWCSHSDLTRVLAPLKALSESRGSKSSRIDELILEGNRLGSLPGHAFQDLEVVRLMLRENALQRLSATALTGQEDAITELFVVEPELTHLAPDLLRPLHRLQAITLQVPKLRRLPRVEGLDGLRYLRMEAAERAAWRGVVIQGLPSLEQLYLGCTERGSGLDKLESGMLHGTPVLGSLTLTECALSWIHPHALTSAANSLNTLDLSDNLLDDVGQVTLALRDLAVLSELRMERNEFRSLPEGSLVSLPALRSLSLAGNRLTEVARGAFHLLPSLESLDLSKNSLKRLHPQAFTPRAAPRLQDLDLSHNLLGHIAEVRPWVTTLPTLRRLDASDNGLEELGWAALGPSGHPTLERLSLDNNRVRVVRRDALSALPALIELHLRNNSLDERSLLGGGSPWNLPGLKGLDLGQNSIRSLDARLLAGLPSLRKLDLSENNLAVLQGSPFSPAPLLEHVNLSYNALEAMPVQSLGPMRALYELDLAHNSLISLPMHPGRALDGLGLLNVAGNQLGSLPDGWAAGQATQTLQLSGNALRSLPKLALKGLTRLDVSRNMLTRLDMDTLGSARELVYLNASNNELSQFPEGVRGLSSLKDLDLSGNRMSSLPNTGVISSLQSLRSLRLARNQITTLASGSVHGLPKLSALSLAENRLVAVDPGALTDLPALAELDMARNALTALPQAAFSRLPALRAASLQGNRLKNFDANTFEGAPRLLLLDLSHNELNELKWGRPYWSGHWGGRDEEPEPPLTGEGRNVRQSRGQATSRALEPGLGESDLIAAPSAMPGLEVLDLSHNQLLNLEDAGVDNLPWLVELKVDDNFICGVRANTLSGLSRLRVLSMRNNRVSMLQERAFRSLRGNMVHLDVAGNPLSCSCGLMWLQAWMEEEPSLQPGTGVPHEGSPRCADGSLLREVALSRSHCQDHKRNVRDEEREEEEIMAQCSTNGSPQILAPAPAKGGLHHPNLGLNPEESEYFDEQYVEYPQGAEVIANHTATTTSTRPPPLATSPSTPAPHVFPDFTPGDTPTIYAGLPPTNNNAPPHVQQQHVPPIVNESPFTLFGYPIPSITSLINPVVGRSSNAGKKIEAQDKNAVVVTPYEDGFLPSLGPPRVRPPWVIGPSGGSTTSNNNTSTSHVHSVSHIEAVTDNKKEVFSSSRHQSSLMEPAKNSMKFPNHENGGRSGSVIPIDHRGSLPIREDSWRNSISENTTTDDFDVTSSRPDRMFMTERPGPTNSPRQKFETTTFPPERTVTSKEEYKHTEFHGVMIEKGVIPLVFAEDKETSTSVKKNLYEPPTERPLTTQAETTTQFTTQTTTQAPYTFPQTTTRRSYRTETTTPAIPTTSEVPGYTNLKLLVPSSSSTEAPNTQHSSKATITKVENVPAPQVPPSHRFASSSRYVNNPAASSDVSSAPSPSSTTPGNDQQGQGTWWYYRDYNRTNLEPFRGEYLLEDNPANNAAGKIITYNMIFYVLSTLFLFM